MTTFSQLVDSMVRDLRRPDMFIDIQAYVNQTIRELHSDPKSGNVHLFDSNLREVLVTVNTESTFIWKQPIPALFQNIRTVCYADVYDSDGRPVFPIRTKPGRAMLDLDAWYYQTANAFAFGGHGGVGSRVQIAYYEYPRYLNYFKTGERPCEYDEIGFKYYGDYRQDEDDREAAEYLCTNWILQRWRTLVEEGVRAKAYKRMGDSVRGPQSYSLYMQQRQQLITSESYYGSHI